MDIHPGTRSGGNHNSSLKGIKEQSRRIHLIDEASVIKTRTDQTYTFSHTKYIVEGLFEVVTPSFLNALAFFLLLVPKPSRDCGSHKRRRGGKKCA